MSLVERLLMENLRFALAGKSGNSVPPKGALSGEMVDVIGAVAGVLGIDYGCRKGRPSGNPPWTGKRGRAKRRKKLQRKARQQEYRRAA